MTTRRAGVYVLLAYALAWAWWLPLAWTGRTVASGGWPTHLPGLLGPAVAAFVATRAADRADLWRRLGTFRIGRRWWLVVASPVLLAGAVLAGRVILGDAPPAEDLWRINGFPAGWGVLGTLVLLVVVNGFGEETGWRGYLQEHLQRRIRPLWAFLVVAVVWAGWHAPLFVILSSYQDFSVATFVGFGFGLVCGAVVLGWLYARTGSVLAVALWHAGYNLAVAPVAAQGEVAAAVTAVVMVVAVGLVVADLRTGGRVLAPSPVRPVRDLGPGPNGIREMTSGPDPSASSP